MLKFAIPVLHISNSGEAEEFYCIRLGFKKEFANRPDEKKTEPCYMGISRDGVWLHLSSFPGDGVSGGVANLYVDDVDALFAEFIAKGVKIDLKPTDQSWGTREMYVKDADGNCLRFVQEGKKK
ncbi:MAG: VOC family protein [candidate division Zixibacteria bacterium]|nr:VOC family protein [candidate division Zixibacteria bacterium]MCI0596827.1 VOC family protein [candidate division Zixibacteria bacterium]